MNLTKHCALSVVGSSTWINPTCDLRVPLAKDFAFTVLQASENCSPAPELGWEHLGVGYLEGVL